MGILLIYIYVYVYIYIYIYIYILNGQLICINKTLAPNMLKQNYPNCKSKIKYLNTLLVLKTR